MNKQPRDKIAKLIIDRSDWLCWPSFGSGNAMHRILIAHQPYLYNAHWNDWGSSLIDSLQAPAQLQKGSPFTRHGRALYGTAHYASILSALGSWDGEKSSLQPMVSESINRLSDSESSMRWLSQWVKQEKRMIFPIGLHLTAQQCLKATIAPIIQLFIEDPNTVIRRAANASLIWSQTPHLKNNCISHPQILNISVEQFFYGTYVDFITLYEQIISHLKIKEDLSERVWAFLLYYRDRMERTLDRDREIILSEFEARCNVCVEEKQEDGLCWKCPAR